MGIHIPPILVVIACKVSIAANPDPNAAFATLASRFLGTKRTGELVRLLAEHGKASPADPQRLLYAGELYLLRGDIRQAEQCFAPAWRTAAKESGSTAPRSRS